MRISGHSKHLSEFHLVSLDAVTDCSIDSEATHIQSSASDRYYPNNGSRQDLKNAVQL